MNATGRTIILTTHFMDEADLLGDRIAIISQGELKCCGSSLFLKKKLGSGYYLTLVQKEGNEEFNSEHVQAVLKQHVPNSSVILGMGSDLVVYLPTLDNDGLDQRGKVPQLLGDLESKMAQLGMESYGVSDTTLEEVFEVLYKIPRALLI